MLDPDPFRREWFAGAPSLGRVAARIAVYAFMVLAALYLFVHRFGASASFSPHDELAVGVLVVGLLTTYLL